MPNFNDWLNEELEHMFPTDILDTLDRSRPYNGQPWTMEGKRGEQVISGITMRDLRDCYIRACYASAPILPLRYPKSIYELPWDKIDPIAVCQNMGVWIEKYMGIFPNTFIPNNLLKNIPIIKPPEDLLEK